MIPKNLLFVLFFTLFSYISFSQTYSLAAFHDYQKHFIIFDGGVTHDVENLPVQSYQVGGNCLAYIDNAGKFKVYHRGEIILLSDILVDKYFATRYLVVYEMFGQLYVFDNGKRQMLTSNVLSYAVGDSIVAFFNRNTNSSHAYYGGRIYNLENALTGQPIQDFKAGDNIFAYFNDNTKYFKIFYHGQLEEITQSNDLIDFKTGLNIVAYVDKSTNTFHAYYKGDIIDLDDFEPKSYKVGDNMVAYISSLDEFLVFVDGEIENISDFEPNAYYVTDSLIVYDEQGYFKVFYNGQIYELENYIPEHFQIQQSTIVYIDLNGWLKTFSGGKQFIVTRDLIKLFQLTYNTILINTTVNTIKIYYDGKLYDTN